MVFYAMCLHYLKHLNCYFPCIFFLNATIYSKISTIVSSTAQELCLLMRGAALSFQPLTVFAKSSIKDVLKGFEYASRFVIILFLNKHCEKKIIRYEVLSTFNPFQPIASFLYPLKTSDNQRFSDVFRGIQIEHWAKILNISSSLLQRFLLSLFSFFRITGIESSTFTHHLQYHQHCNIFP